MEIASLIESVKYVTDSQGKQTDVIVPIDVWHKFLGVLQDDKAQIENTKSAPVIEEYEDDGIPSVAEVVARIKATPPNPAMIRLAQGSVDDLTQSEPNAEFDLNAWEQDWAAAMEELRQINYGANRNKGHI